MLLVHVRYYKPETRGLDFEGLMEDIKNAPNGSVFLLHGKRHIAAFTGSAAALVCEVLHACVETTHKATRIILSTAGTRCLPNVWGFVCHDVSLGSPVQRW